jgi:SAM-dependent methyltransferase
LIRHWGAIVNSEDIAAIRRRYIEHLLPTTDGAPLFPFVDVISDIAPGHALDLAAGDGAAAIYLAQAGWQVEGIDLIDTAVQLAHMRIENADLNASVRISTADWLGYETHASEFDLALDIGSLHAHPAQHHDAYIAKLRGALRLNALAIVYLLFEPAQNHVEFSTPAQLRLRLSRQFETLELVNTNAQFGMRTVPALWLLLRAR